MTGAVWRWAVAVANRVEAGHWWPLGRLLLPGRVRVAACRSRGEHRPELVDLGRRKVCAQCGAW